MLDADTARDPTPEGIELSLRLAGPTARALAWLIDLVVRLAVIGAVGIVLGILGKFGVGLMLIVWFALEWLYPTAFEVWFAGATPGKRSLGLVVLHDDGTPIRLPASFTRNLLRAIDFMPVLLRVRPGVDAAEPRLQAPGRHRSGHRGGVSRGGVRSTRRCRKRRRSRRRWRCRFAEQRAILDSGHPLGQPDRRARGGAGRAGPASDRGGRRGAGAARRSSPSPTT